MDDRIHFVGIFVLQSTMVEAFQRIKVDEVVFADEKLKDNSYRAKVS